MDYQYESLGDERFQEFCHCLITKEFPNSQAFPVGQPDGGRDSLAFSMSSTKKEFVVFQVKFVRNPKKIQDVHKWLTKTISEERKKIKKLIPKGAKSYYLLTNVNGTAHLDGGSIDKVNEILENSISIPSMCWWRDDLSRKFEADPMFKWSFPEILNGQDILNLALFQNLNEHKERRENAIQSYLADQYDLDNKVKFRQIDLQNFLFGLFTDVPVRIKKVDEKNKPLSKIIEHLFIRSYRSKRSLHHDEYLSLDEPQIGAAEFLLNPVVQNGIKRILLEGGPGQGKSTISQFICQVHRARLLEKEEDLKRIPEDLKNNPVRIPIKIDLRHLASWTEKKNPYKESVSDEYFEKIWDKSLEAFLVCHIFYHSRNRDFSSNDLIAICKLSQILIVFDGFDEIANLEVRKEVVELINKGLNRLSQNCKSIQVLITSRPAAFSDATGFSVEQYPHFELNDITPSIIEEYVEKWVKASGLNQREAAEIKRLVNDKLELPHLRDLAKSPMQLAIFISLLRTKGEALPNKRTALYDNYINLFFDREAEKNIVIRDNRDLIIDIHQYLAWILHSESELSKTSGIIQFDELKACLTEYLEKEEHDIKIADIFTVVEERVCALVSRVQGTYEFEVQPLREYFCARYLYTTAPHSSAGSEKAGAKPDRFEAISRNFYWQNILRFFAGCFDKGELPMITQELRRLLEDELIQFTNYPYILASQLLSDYVFAQSPRNQKDVIRLVENGIKNGKLSYQDRSRSDNEQITLPAECGGNAITDECFNQLKNFPKDDYAGELIRVINDNPYDKEKHWKEHVSKLKGKQLTKWFEYAEHLRILETLEVDTIEKIIESDNKELRKRLQILISGDRLDVLDKNSKLKEATLDGILNSEIYPGIRGVNYHSLNFLFIVLHPYFLTSVIDQKNEGTTYLNYLQKGFPIYPRETDIKSFLEFQVIDEIDGKIQKFSKRIYPKIKEDLTNWTKSIEPWDMLVESGREIFGECWGLNLIAVISSGIKSGKYFKSHSDLNDKTKSLCKRVRYARMKSGNIKYWEEKLKNPDDLTLLIFFTWATPKTICSLLPFLSSKIVSLSQDSFLKLAYGISQTSVISSFTKSQQETIEIAITENSISNSLIYLLCNRMKRKRRGEFIYKNIDEYTGVLKGALKHSVDYLTAKFLKNPTDKKTLTELKKSYIKNEDFHPYIFYYFRTKDNFKIPLEISKNILKDRRSYPRQIISLAQISSRTEVNNQLKPVGKIAQEDKWFDQ